jgi:magnesium transporter
MKRSARKSNRKVGLPPGTLVHLGKQKTEKVRISIVEYTNESCEEFICDSVEDAFEYRDSEKKSWINIDGLHNVELIASIGQHFGLDSLLLEDILDTGHRPKVDEYDNHLFVTLKMLGISTDGLSIASEQVSIVLGHNWLISFQEIEGDLFDLIRERLRDGKTKLRTKGVDYLLYRLIDTVVDNYFHVTDYLSEKLEDLEDGVLSDTKAEHLEEIQRYRKQFIGLRRNIGPLRESITELEKGNSSFIGEDIERYLRDVYEHIIHINETMEGQRDMVAGIRDLYMTSISNRMNQIMKVLTIVSTIFIPLTFIAGIYGMNFDRIPELHWENGYFMAWGIMIILTIGMLILFRRKKWL